MKIRNLLIKLKQKQIVANNPYILVFHCSGLTNLQWRQLKLLLHNTFALRDDKQQQTSQKMVIDTNNDRLTNDQTRNATKLLLPGALQSSIFLEPYKAVKSNSFFQAVRNSNNTKIAASQRLWRLRRPVRLHPHTKRCLTALSTNQKKKKKVGQNSHAKLMTATNARTNFFSTQKFHDTPRINFDSASHYSLQSSESFKPNTSNLLRSSVSRKYLSKNKTSAINLVSSMRGRKDYFNVVNILMQKSFEQTEVLQQNGKKTYKVLTPIQKHAKKQSGPFCLLYSTHNKLPEAMLSNNKNAFPWSNLLTTIKNSFEYKTNLVLLYGHINCDARSSAAIRLYNHIDVQESISLDKKNVLTVFLQSINYHTHYFNQCLKTMHKTEV